ncbi:conserved hypothetical protein [Candidatus Accumulibacter aalborgensis]|uniref:ATPase AAA-type core domain-containing protein n=1 Tax=Candidatus Accumulibacter aalborgensis TaxID=1860102 RepID=A0A1A8XUJ9_9PROT|nr:DUF3696 domain-containing protein [Candidatus Accumulibacter aalborgensis]SBT08734.1 conserved hypothetical protein [Candidatus Accumulibacter aalborgensis]
MNLETTRTIFTGRNYVRTRETAKLDEYQAPTSRQFLYLNKERTSIRVVIHPDLCLEPFLALAGVSCKAREKFYHHINLRHFPSRQHGGSTEIRYGSALEIDSLESLACFLQLFDTPAGRERQGADLPPRLTAIELEYFKGVGKRVRLELAPITLLFGANSAGKSTILQALQYVREVLERRNANPDHTLHGGDFVDLGGFCNLVHQRDLSRRISIKLEMALNRASLPDLVPDTFDEWQTDDPGVWEFHSLLEETKQRTDSVSIQLTVGWSSFRQAAVVVGYEAGLNGDWLVRIESSEGGRDAEVKVNPGNPVLMHFRTQDEVDTHKALLADLGLDRQPDTPTGVDASASPDNDHDADNHEYSIWPDITNALDEMDIKGADRGFRQWLTDVEGALPNLAPLLYVPTGRVKGSDAVYIAREFTAFLSSVVVGPGVLIRDQLRKLRYLGPIRNVPPRKFEAVLTPDEARWADGMAAWERLLTCDEQLIKEVSRWMSSPDKLATGYEIERRTVQEIDSGVLEWLLDASDPDSLRRFDPQLESELRSLPEQRRLNLIETNSGMRMQARDVGIGISQVLPVVVAALDLEPSASLVAIEQPELHIHPAVQVGVGDLLIQGAKINGITFLVETHSEHLILRLLRRIRETEENELPPGAPAVKPEDVTVVYVQTGEQGVELIALPIDETGEFTERWPKGFFVERGEELF